MDVSISQYILKSLEKFHPKGAMGKALSKRELEVLNLLAKGCLKKEIADQLDISPCTVETHVRHIYKKLSVRNAAEAVNKAYSAGIFPSE